MYFFVLSLPASSTKHFVGGQRVSVRDEALLFYGLRSVASRIALINWCGGGGLTFTAGIYISLWDGLFTVITRINNAEPTAHPLPMSFSKIKMGYILCAAIHWLGIYSIAHF